MFLHVCVILFTGGAIPACIAGGIPACLAAGLQGGAISACIAGGIPACLAAGLRGVPALGGACSQGGLLRGGSAPGEVLGGDHTRHGYCCGQYASYWNAFLLLMALLCWQNCSLPVQADGNVWFLPRTITLHQGVCTCKESMVSMQAFSNVLFPSYLSILQHKALRSSNKVQGREIEIQLKLIYVYVDQYQFPAVSSRTVESHSSVHAPHTNTIICRVVVLRVRL